MFICHLPNKPLGGRYRGSPFIWLGVGSMRLYSRQELNRLKVIPDPSESQGKGQGKRNFIHGVLGQANEHRGQNVD